MRVLAGVECVDALECVRKRARIAGGALSGKICCATEEEEKLKNIEHIDEGRFLCAMVDLLQGKVQYW